MLVVLTLGGTYLYKYLFNEATKKTIPTNSHNTTRKTNKVVRINTTMDTTNKVYTQINDYLESVNFNGTITIMQEGELKLNKGYGMKNFDTLQPNDANTMYLIGSSQKFLTGLMLKQLAIAKQINMEASLTQYIPWFQTIYPLNSNDLMLHQSGLFKYQPSEHVTSIQEATQAMQRRGINPNLYKKQQYNDGNYIALAHLIEVVTHQSYEQAFKRMIMQPNNLTYTAFYNDSNFAPHMEIRYKQVNRQPHKEQPHCLNQYYGAGNLYMAPYDMAQLILNLQHNKIFSAVETLPFIKESMTSRYPKAYRFGYYSFPDKNRINGGFYGQVFTVYFNDRYIIVMGTNYEQPHLTNESMLKHIFKHYLKQENHNYNKTGQTY